MSSRIRENVRYLFEYFCEVAEGDEATGPHIVRKYPDTFREDDELKTVPKFTFPCSFSTYPVQQYSFVLTSLDSKYTFCFCRYEPRTKSSLVILSHLPWHDTFYNLLQCISTLMRGGGGGGAAGAPGTAEDGWAEARSFLDACRTRPPLPGHTLRISFAGDQSVFTCRCPDPKHLPSIPENYNITEYYSAVYANCMAGVWAALLRERRVAIVAAKPARLSAAVHAANGTLYPMSWQHIFIPILPPHLVDYLQAPMPYLLGVPTNVMKGVRQSDIGDVVILDVDNKTLSSPFNDLENLPTDVSMELRRALSENIMGDAVSRAFIRALAALIGGYRDAIRIEDGKITFNEEAFIKTRKHIQPYLKEILTSQIFRQFVEERLELLNSGRGFRDPFEDECALWAERAASGSRRRIARQSREWALTVRRESNNLIRTVKDKANPAVKSAVKTVREGGKNVKSAMRGLKMKMPKAGSRPVSADALHDDRRSSFDSGTPISSSSSMNSLAAAIQAAEAAPVPTPHAPPSEPLSLDLLGEMELLFPRPETPDESDAAADEDTRPAIPPRPLARYPIVATSELLGCEAPLPPPRVANTRGYRAVLTPDHKPSLATHEPIRFTALPGDHTKLKASVSSGAGQPAAASSSPLHASSSPLHVASSPALSVSPLRQPPPVPQRPPREVGGLCPDLIHFESESASNSLEEFDPLRQTGRAGAPVAPGRRVASPAPTWPAPNRTAPVPASGPASQGADSALLQEYGLDFSRFGLVDPPVPSNSQHNGWTIFN